MGFNSGFKGLTKYISLKEVVLEILVIAYLLREFHSVYGALMFPAVFTKALHCALVVPVQEFIN